VTEVAASGDAVTIRSADADATLPALYALGRPVRGLEVGGGGLEEALLALTGDGGAAPSNLPETTKVG
jgi:ABC-2 type transport system ATP-binding protein